MCAAAGSSRCFGFPDHVLLDTVGRMGRCRNETTAYAETSGGYPIEVSFVVADPPAVTRCVAHCSGLTEYEFLQLPPCITGADGAFLLVRVITPRRSDRLMSVDVFVYRAGPGKPSLQHLPRPYPLGLGSDYAGVLSCGEHCLVVVPERQLRAGQLSYHFHVFSSGATPPWSWTTRIVPLPANMMAYNAAFCPDKVFSVQGGSLAWVDLRNGILLCDSVAEDPKVQLIPLPALMPINRVEFGPDSDGIIPPLDPIRDVAFRNGRSFRFIEVGFLDPDSFYSAWTATMLMRGIGSDEAWEPETCPTVNSADLSTIDLCLPYLPSDIWDFKESRLTFNNVMSSEPILDQSRDNVFYMSIKVKYNDPNGWVMAVDAESKKVENVVPFCAERFHLRRTLLQCAFSKHLSAPDANVCITNGLNSTIIKEDMMPLVFCAVSIMLVQHKFIQFVKKHTCEKPSKDEVWSLFHTGVTSVMNQHMNQVVQYATNNYLAFNAVNIVWRASKDIKKLLEDCNDPSTCTGTVRDKIKVAIGALDELVHTLPTEVLDVGRRMSAVVCTDK